MFDDQTVKAAAELINYGLQPRLYPQHDDRYNELLARYRIDLSFQRLVDTMASGFHLFNPQPVGATQSLGLFLSAEPGSAFSVERGDFLSSMKSTGFRDRVLYGLILMAIAACCYPQAHDLEDATVRVVTVSGVDQYLHDLAKQAEKQAGADVRSGQTAARPVYFQYLVKSEVTGQSRQSAAGTTHMIRKTLETLADWGHLRRSNREDTYEALARFRIAVRDVASMRAFREMRHLEEGRLDELPPEEEAV